MICVFCRNIISGWKKGDRAYPVHKRLFPDCPFIKREDVGNKPLPPPRDDYMDIEIVPIEVPKKLKRQHMRI